MRKSTVVDFRTRNSRIPGINSPNALMPSAYDMTSFLAFYCSQLSAFSFDSPPCHCQRCIDTTDPHARRFVQINIPPCHHIMCITCLTNHLNRGHRRCPFCRTEWWTLDPSGEGERDTSHPGQPAVTPWSSPNLPPEGLSLKKTEEYRVSEDGSLLFETVILSDEDGGIDWSSNNGKKSKLRPTWVWTFDKYSDSMGIVSIGITRNLRAFGRHIAGFRPRWGTALPKTTCSSE